METKNDQANSRTSFRSTALTTAGLMLGQLTFPAIGSGSGIKSIEDTPPHFSTQSDSRIPISIDFAGDLLLYVAPLADSNSIEISPVASHVVAAVLAEDPSSLSEFDIGKIVLRSLHTNPESVALPGLPRDSLQRLMFPASTGDTLYCVILALDDHALLSTEKQPRNGKILNALSAGEFSLVWVVEIDTKTREVDLR